MKVLHLRVKSKLMDNISDHTINVCSSATFGRVLGAGWIIYCSNFKLNSNALDMYCKFHVSVQSKFSVLCMCMGGTNQNKIQHTLS